MRAHVFFGLGMAAVSQLRESPHVGKEDGYLPARADKGELFGLEQLIDNVRRDQLGENGFNSAALVLFEERLVGQQAKMGEHRSAHGHDYWQHEAIVDQGEKSEENAKANQQRHQDGGP